MPSDSFGVVVNEATLKSLGIEDPLNTRFEEPSDDGSVERYYPIIGVVKDFHFESVQKEITPMVIHFMRGNYEGVIVFKLGGGNIPATLDFVQQKWEEFDTGYPFENSWLDDEFGRLFETERRTAGIRKIMGASVNTVMLLLSRETVRLLAIATALSIPAYFGIKAWLQNFAYTISYNPGIYALILILVATFVLLIALVAVSYISYRAATSNPAQSLKVE